MRTSGTTISDSLKYENVYAGNSFSIVKDYNNKYYGMGVSTSGQLTFLPEPPKADYPVFLTPQLRIPKLTYLPAISKLNVNYIACGDAHVILVCKNNSVYSYGQNTNGELGLGHNDNVYILFIFK